MNTRESGYEDLNSQPDSSSTSVDIPEFLFLSLIT